jgi:5'-deoxynucleotidase YfbR-like HD superfamily hydrolase
MEKETQGLVDIGRMVLSFAKVNRVTLHEDGKRLESDTDHTVMLSICALAIGDTMYKDKLDLGLVAQFALVHDLVEVYAMDTDSFGLSEQGRKEKEEREHAAFLKIKEEFKDVFPWIPNTIEKYEALDSIEARFVKTLDKAMSKITHILNNGQYFKNRGLTKEEMWRDYTTVVKTAESKYGKEFPEIIAMMEELMVEVKEKSYNE